MKIYDYTSGTCITEQDFITVLDDFLLNTITGWTRIEKVSDLSSDRDYAWKSPGETPADNGDIYIRFRGYSDNVYLYGYGVYVSSASYADQMYDVSYTYMPTNGLPFKYWLYGDRNFVCVIILNNSTGNTHTVYAGLIRSYYVPVTDPLPLLIRGNTSADYPWTDATNSRAYMFNCVSSGVAVNVSYNWSTLLGNDVGVRSSAAILFPVMLMNRNAGAYEVRGEPYGVYQVNGFRVGPMSALITASGIFVVFRQGGSSYTDRTYAFGPVAPVSEETTFTV